MFSCTFIPELDNLVLQHREGTGLHCHSPILSDTAAEIRSPPDPTVGAYKISSQIVYMHGVYGQSDRRILVNSKHGGASLRECG